MLLWQPRRPLWTACVLRTLSWFVSYQRLSPQLQFSLSAAALAIYKYISVDFVCDGRAVSPAFSVPYRLPWQELHAQQLPADGISSCCYIVNVHNHPSWATSGKEGMTWYSCRPLPSIWLQPHHSVNVRSGCIGISERKGWYNSAYTVYTAKTLYRKFETNIPRNGSVRPRSKFLHSWFRE
jgi:hypothetical protein